jgi:DMSO reductase anchor subunit
MSIVTFVPLLWSAWACVIECRYLALPGLAGSVLSLVTVFCTAMIYTSLKSVQAWHTPLTPACYLLFAVAGGLVLASLFAFAGGGNASLLAVLAAIALMAAWIVKASWRRNMLTLTPISTPETATGLGAIGKVRLFERPHVMENYLTHEMGFRIARKHAAKLWNIAVVLGGAIPALALLLLAILGQVPGTIAAMIASVAVLSHVIGMLAERWLFFAEARHAVMNYYNG